MMKFGARQNQQGANFTEECMAVAAMFIKKEGTEQFLVNLLHVLRQTFPQRGD